MSHLLDCPFCFPNVERSLTILSSTNNEYYLAVKTMDGTKKWYVCSNCSGVFCRDKLRASWQLSPGTYLQFIEKGWIKDLINS